jgi:aspartate-semialdehyde dehydrogenase
MSLRVAIVGATGAVGEELLRVLEQRRFPVGELLPMASERSAGRSVEFRGKRVAVAPLDVEKLKGCDVAFLSAGASVSRRIVPQLRGARVRVYDNTSAYRLDPAVPLVVPEVNPQDLTAEHHVASVGNCTAILLVLALAPLEAAFGLERVIVSTYQAVSGAGRKALERLRDELRRELDGAPAAAEASTATPSAAGSPPPFAFNCIPSIGEIDAGDDEASLSTGEEKKVAAEVRRVLARPDLPIVATCVRVPVLRAHSESVYVELKDRAAKLPAVRAALAAAPGVEMKDDLAHGVMPMPRAAAGIDGIHVGRLRPGDRPGSYAFFLAGDQLRKGAALTAVQLAELQLPAIRAASGVS